MDFFRSSTQLFLLGIGSVVSFVGLLFLVSLIPTDLTLERHRSTLERLQIEGTYPSVGAVGRPVVLDNFTDALMINTALHGNVDEPLRAALLNERVVVSGAEINQTKNLARLIEGAPFSNSEVVQYERYWHGYLVLLKPLLALFSYDQVRLFLTGVQLTGAALLTYLFWNQKKYAQAIALIVALTAVDFWLISQSLQFSSVFLIGFFTSCIYLLYGKKFVSAMTLAFCVGALTAFFDLLTAPMITLAFVYLAVWHRQLIWSEVVGFAIIWVAGYLGVWASKWVLVELLASPGAIATALDQVQNRTVTRADPSFSHPRAVLLNVQQLIGYSSVSKVVFAIVALALSMLLLRYHQISKQKIMKLLPLGPLLVIPYLWYLVAANHSYLHVWYTYRAQFMTIVALALIYIECLDWRKLSQDFRIFFKYQKT